MNADEALELARKAYPNDEYLRVAYMLGLCDGYELHEERMMEEAVEAKFISMDEGIIKYSPLFTRKLKQIFRPSDKIRIIIVKED